MATKIQQSGRIRFKPYQQDIVLNLPVYLPDLVAENALAQIIHELVEGIELHELEVYYSELGSPPYHPRLMLKVWLYGYCTGVFTSRPLAQKLREDLIFIWLAGGQRPCFKTLSDFRSCRMQDLVDTVLISVLSYLVEHGYVNLEDLYGDGSKWEANANRHKMVWRKNTERHQQNVRQRIADLLVEWRSLQQAEDAAYGHRDLAGHQSAEQIQVVLSSADLQGHLAQLNAVIEQQSDRKRQGALRKIHRGLTQEQTKLAKYEQQQVVLGDRNSYAKTDEDATAVRMKDERLLPGYNVQITTSEQFIVTATLHQQPSDSPTLPSHLSTVQEHLADCTPPDWQPAYTADAGYGSEENYAWLESHHWTAYVKYPLWYQEHTGRLQKRRFASANWPYDAEQDCYVCPNQKKLVFKKHEVQFTATGYERQLRVYESEGCAGCALFDQCRSPQAPPESNRQVQRSEQLEAYKQAVKERLASPSGQVKRSRRSAQVETPFAQLKHNLGHRRFALRGLAKVNVELQWLVLAHNLRKIYCRQTGIWQAYYAQRAARRAKKGKNRA